MHLFLSIILLIQFFSWRFRFSFRGRTSSIKHELNIKPVKAEKDDTDLALGVEEAVNRGFTEIHIYGATGGRLDHFMGVLQILQKPKYIEQNIIIIVEDHKMKLSY